MKGVCGRIRNGKAICIAYAIEDRSTEGCELGRPGVRGAFKNVTGSRIGTGNQGSRGRELWSVPHHPPWGSVEDSPDCVVAHAE